MVSLEATGPKTPNFREGYKMDELIVKCNKCDAPLGRFRAYDDHGGAEVLGPGRLGNGKLPYGQAAVNGMGKPE